VKYVSRLCGRPMCKFGSTIGKHVLFLTVPCPEPSLTCGHSFCKACLIDWFGTALAQHLQTYPDYNPHPPALQQYMAVLNRQNFPPQQRRAIECELRSMYESIQRPAYTCPKCRDPVERAPIDCFLLKNVTQAVAKHSGEGGTEPAGTANPQEGVWDGFFPPMPKFLRS
jgi:hypothetical protein